MRSAPRLVGKGSSEGNDSTRTKAALSVWQSTSPAGGTLVETYLSSRDLSLSPPATLRFHVGLRHPSGGIWPAMVALITDGVSDTPLAIHRTFIAPNGAGKAPVEPQKMMLGPCRGGAVRLGPIGESLVVGEGIETILSVMQATRLSGWAALSASGLRMLKLPPVPLAVQIVVAADNDPTGRAAAEHAATAWTAEGRKVRIALPQIECADFNDVLSGAVA
jgi:hypothetical protein